MLGEDGSGSGGCSCTLVWLGESGFFRPDHVCGTTITEDCVTDLALGAGPDDFNKCCPMMREIIARNEQGQATCECVKSKLQRAIPKSVKSIADAIPYITHACLGDSIFNGSNTDC